MNALHEEVAIANDGLAALMGRPVDNDVLTDGVIVANDDLAALSLKLKVLREGTYHRALVDLVVLSHLGAIENAHEWEDGAVVANLHVVLNIHEREYLNVVANLRLGRNHGLVTYLIHSRFVNY